MVHRKSKQVTSKRSTAKKSSLKKFRRSLKSRNSSLKKVRRSAKSHRKSSPKKIRRSLKSKRMHGGFFGLQLTPTASANITNAKTGLSNVLDKARRLSSDAIAASKKTVKDYKSGREFDAAQKTDLKNRRASYISSHSGGRKVKKSKRKSSSLTKAKKVKKSHKRTSLRKGRKSHGKRR